MIFFPPKIHGPFSNTVCISSSVLKRKMMKPLEVVITCSKPCERHALNAIELTAWNGILNPGKKPIMHRFHCAEFSSSISSVILRL
jgi:hypothetical protein